MNKRRFNTIAECTKGLKDLIMAEGKLYHTPSCAYPDMLNARFVSELTDGIEFYVQEVIGNESIAGRYINVQCAKMFGTAQDYDWEQVLRYAKNIDSMLQKIM